MSNMNGSLNDKLKYTKATQKKDVLEVFVDVNYAGNLEIRNKFSSFVFMLFEKNIC